MNTQIQIGRLYNVLEVFKQDIEHRLHATMTETKLPELLTLLTEAVDVVESRIEVLENSIKCTSDLLEARVAKAEAIATKALTVLETLSDAAAPKTIKKALEEMKTAANELHFLKSKL